MEDCVAYESFMKRTFGVARYGDYAQMADADQFESCSLETLKVAVQYDLGSYFEKNENQNSDATLQEYLDEVRQARNKDRLISIIRTFNEEFPNT